MAMTKAEKIARARDVAQWTLRRMMSQGNRFYRYKDHYYLRAGDDSRYLIDFRRQDDIVEEVWICGGLPHPSCQYKKVLVDELLRQARWLAVSINTNELTLSAFANPMLPEIDQLEQFVNACDERNG